MFGEFLKRLKEAVMQNFGDTVYDNRRTQYGNDSKDNCLPH